MELERTIGITALSNASIGINVASKTVAFPCGSVVTEYNPKKNRQVDFYDCDQCISCVRYSPDSSLVVVGQRGSKSSLVVWRCSDKKVLFTGHGHRLGIACVAFSADGRYIASVGYKSDGKFLLWDIQQQKNVAKGTFTSGVASIDFNTSLNAFVTAGADSALHFWYLKDIEVALLQQVKSANSDPVAWEPKPAVFGDKLGPRSVDFVDVKCGQGTTCAGYTYTVTSSGILCSFNASRLPYRWVDLKVNNAFSLDVSANKIFIGCSDATIRVFEPGSLKYLKSLAKMKLRDIHQGHASVVQWPNDGGLDAHAQTSKKTDDAAGAASRATVLEPAVVCVKCIANTNRIIAVYGDRSVFIFDVAEKLAKYRSFLHHTGCIWDLVVVPYSHCDSGGSGSTHLAPPGSFLSCGSDDTVRFWTLDLNRSSYNARPDVWKHKFSRELLRVVNCGDDFSSKNDNATVYATTSIERAQMHPPNVGIRQLAVSADGSTLAIGSKHGNIAVLDLHAKDLDLKTAPLKVHESDVTCLNFSPAACRSSGKGDETPLTPMPVRAPLLVSGSRDKQAKILKADTLECVGTLQHHKTSIRVADFDRSGRRIVTCGSETPARIVTVERRYRAVALLPAFCSLLRHVHTRCAQLLCAHVCMCLFGCCSQCHGRTRIRKLQHCRRRCRWFYLRRPGACDQQVPSHNRNRPKSSRVRHVCAATLVELLALHHCTFPNLIAIVNIVAGGHFGHGFKSPRCAVTRLTTWNSIVCRWTRPDHTSLCVVKTSECASLILFQVLALPSVRHATVLESLLLPSRQIACGSSRHALTDVSLCGNSAVNLWFACAVDWMSSACLILPIR